MGLFDHDDYRAYLRAHLRQLPRKGRGELSRMAKALGTNSTLMSQVLGGGRDFNAEQTFALSRYLGHTEVELEFFSLLVQRERAGSHELKEHLAKRLAQIKNEAQKLARRISHDRSLTDAERAVFYSSWIYSAVHLFTSLREKGATLEEAAEYFDLPRARASEVLRFLVAGRLVEEEKGRFRFAVRSTFVEKGSPYLLKHHANWRVKAMQKSETLADDELMYTGQFSLSAADFLRLREKMAEFLKSLNQTVKDSPAERLAAFNMDWFLIEK